MTPIRCFLAVGALIAALTALPTAQSLAGPDEAASSGVVVSLEVWRVTDAETVKQVEALTDKDPGGADAVRAVVTTEGKALRVARFVTPTQFGKEVEHSDRAEKAFTAPRKRTGGAVGVGFGGFSSEGTTVKLIAKDLASGTIEIQLALKATAQGEPKVIPGGPMIPPEKFTAEVIGTVAGASGTTRMFVSQSASRDAMIVFVKATRL